MRERWVRTLPALVGVYFVVHGITYFWLREGNTLVSVVEVGVPISLGILLVGFGLWNRDEPTGTRHSLGLFTWTVLGGVLFAAIALWLEFIAQLEGGVFDHDTTYLWLNAAAIGATGNALVGWLYLRLLAESERRDRTAAELRERNHRLDRFASTVTHDLRNPLAIARGRTQLAYENPAAAREHLEPALDALARVDDRVEDLLALARDGEVGSGEPVSLREAARTAWGTLETTDATLDVRDGTVESSERLLVQALENLLENAVEHGGPDVTVRVEALPDGGFRVADDGPGIPERERERILEPGVSGRQDRRGHGEGLAIVEAIAEAHGWDVRVGESELGGANFEFHPTTSTQTRAVAAVQA